MQASGLPHFILFIRKLFSTAGYFYTFPIRFPLLLPSECLIPTFGFGHLWLSLLFPFSVLLIFNETATRLLFYPLAYHKLFAPLSDATCEIEFDSTVVVFIYLLTGHKEVVDWSDCKFFSCPASGLPLPSPR